MNPISMLPFAVGQLAACAAFLMLAYAGFLLGERRPSTEAKIAAIGFAYSAIGIFAQIVSIFSERMFSDSGMAGMWNSLWFNLLFNYPRPWVLLVVAFCLIRLVRQVPEQNGTVEP
jgi:hypothetical protein